ncbi:MAG: putative zinc-binding metallopeptidase [Planctomycetia bacterium]|nr:putative zinc-binding metallopeptidase [Planctomycetia bacterium]
MSHNHVHKPASKSVAKAPAAPPARGSQARSAWASLRDEQLLDVRFCDLGLKIEGTAIEFRIARLYEELASRRLRFQPHCWLSEEWFSPDGVPGIAIPFYLAHPRLMRLERTMMLEVEGATHDQCMKSLRHEAGHALDSAYRLFLRKEYRSLFGRNSVPYPTFYQPKPFSRSFVLHLDLWYAQSHPVEDFAETFAVWLRPLSRWRTQYSEWPAMKKLVYVDRLMASLRDVPPKVRSREQVEPLRTNRKTLREHYQAKRQFYAVESQHFYDRELRRLFSDQPEFAGNLSAAAFLRRLRPELRQVVAHWTGQYQYIINQVLDQMIVRCRDMKLRVHRPLPEAERDVLVMLTVQTMNYLHGGHHRLAL